MANAVAVTAARWGVVPFPPVLRTLRALPVVLSLRVRCCWRVKVSTPFPPCDPLRATPAGNIPPGGDLGEAAAPGGTSPVTCSVHRCHMRCGARPLTRNSELDRRGAEKLFRVLTEREEKNSAATAAWSLHARRVRMRDRSRRHVRLAHAWGGTGRRALPVPPHAHTAFARQDETHVDRPLEKRLPEGQRAATW
jgi:hypothetical protein